MTFTFNDIPDLTGQVAVVTGANSGIGLVTARQLALRNCHVILACRSAERTRPVVDALGTEISATSGKVEFMALDMMSLASIRDFVAAFIFKNLPLHILVNNAGIYAVPFSLSVDGIEAQFATNHVGVMALTLGLIPILETARVAKIVCVSSAVHQMAPKMGINFDHINDEAVYNKNTAYGQSKLATILFARELHKRLRARGVNHVYVNALHPGIVRTDIFREVPWIVQQLLWVFQRSADDGAKTQLYCAASPEIEKKDLSGEYFTAIAKLKKTTKLGLDMALAAKLWTFTEELIASKTPVN